MPLDVAIYRRMIDAPPLPPRQHPRRISVVDIRPEDARHAFVFVHGYGGSALQWLPQLRYFGQFAHVVAPDLRGHGLSEDPRDQPITLDGLVDDLALVVERLGLERPFTLVAHSFGGAIATEFTLRHPDAVHEVVLIGVPAQFVVQPWVRRGLRVPNALFNTLVRRLHIALYAPLHTLRRMHAGAMAPWPGTERLPQLRVPTLVVLGQRDRVFVRERYEDTTRLIPGAQQIVIPVSAHLVQLERPDAVNRAIRRFVASRDPATSMPASGPLIGDAPLMRRATARWLVNYDQDVPDAVPVPRQSLADLLATAAREFPNRAALIYFGQQIGYRELDRLSNRFAHALVRHGIQPGDRVGIVLPNIPQCVIAFFGTLKAGGVVVLGSPLTTEREIADQLCDAGATILVTLASYRRTIGRICAGTAIREVILTDVREYLPLPQRVRLARMLAMDAAPHSSVGQTEMTAMPGTDMTASSPISGTDANVSSPADASAMRDSVPKSVAFQRLLAGQPATPLPTSRAGEDLALLQYTSGTVEPPRGAMLTHANLLANVSQVRHWVADAERGREVLVCPLPLSHSYGVTAGLNLTVALAGTLVLLPTTRIEVILQAIRRHHPTLLPGVPSLYLAIANYPHVRRYGVASIRACISGSAPLPVEVQEAFEKLTRGRLVEGYGLTEASPSTHCNPLQGERRVGSIGIPLPSTDARIVHQTTGTPLPVGEVGELLIRGPQVMQGYWQRPDDTARTLADGWLHTGDLARMDEDGFFTIVERKRDVILYGPYNIYPREVEEVLYEHPKVLEAAVVGESNGHTNGADPPVIKAVVVLKHGEHATPDELLALCRERLDAYKVPRAIEFRNELPKNFVGKILRRLLVNPSP
jgi:long-chain acyl-CoA synthetase